jgi:hypothetical protein
MPKASWPRQYIYQQPPLLASSRIISHKCIIHQHPQHVTVNDGAPPCCIPCTYRIREVDAATMPQHATRLRLQQAPPSSIGRRFYCAATEAFIRHHAKNHVPSPTPRYTTMQHQAAPTHTAHNYTSTARYRRQFACALFCGVRYRCSSPSGFCRGGGKEHVAGEARRSCVLPKQCHHQRAHNDIFTCGMPPEHYPNPQQQRRPCPQGWKPGTRRRSFAS